MVGRILCCGLILWMLAPDTSCQHQKTKDTMFVPLSYDEAAKKADSVLLLMTRDEKIALVSGDRGFFIRPLPRLGLSEVYMSDATQGVHIRTKFLDDDLSAYALDRTTAFPAPICLASTWNPSLAERYARSVGEECRAGGIGILLGPGMNEYRTSQCGRNFEYFGEDPFLRARMIEKYVTGLQSTGTVATLKHFVANNTEYFRRRSNSVIDDRTLHEIYLPPFKAGIDAGARAVMTSYNQLNGEWCGQSAAVVDTLLRRDLGFHWLVMSDWWSVYDGVKFAGSGADLEMPVAIALADAAQNLRNGKLNARDLDRMAGSILRTCYSMRLYGRTKDPAYETDYPEHERIALQVAREGIVLLKNTNEVLPISSAARKILVTGEFLTEYYGGGGSAAVAGYDIITLQEALEEEFGDRIRIVPSPSPQDLQQADLVLCCVGTRDREGADRSFALPPDQEHRVMQCVAGNPRTVVLVMSGGGVRMTAWHERAAAIVYTWYYGQHGSRALVEILSGKTNPSGRLPITIERDFADGPGDEYIPEGEQLSTPRSREEEHQHPVFDIRYQEGIFVGYRWYEKKGISPLYPFGHGLSYTSFSYSEFDIATDRFAGEGTVTVSATITNSGNKMGAEVVQLYVGDPVCSFPRPTKELKGVRKVVLQPGQRSKVVFVLDKSAFSFWNPAAKTWYFEAGTFVVSLGSSVQAIRESKEIEIR